MRSWFKHPAWRVAGFVFSTLLIVASIWFALSSVDFAALLHISPWVIVGLGLLFLGSVLVTSGIFLVVTKSFRYDPSLSLWWMTVLIALSTLLNYVPLVKAGLWGRTAYLKTRFGVPVRDSVLTLGVIAVLTLVLMGVFSVYALVASPPLFWPLSLVTAVLLTVVSPVVFKQVVGRRAYAGLTWVPLRVLDIVTASARMWLVFDALGQPITVPQAVVISSASLLVKLSGVTPNGLGLSEWVVGAMAAAMSDINAGTAVAAALVDRAVEVVVSVVAGLVSWAAISRRR